MDLNNSTTKEEERDYAQTPKWFFKAFGEDVLKMNFTLDVCANKATAKVSNYYSLDEDGNNGLHLPWSKVNWCNPPYSKIQPWGEKAAQEASKGNITAMLIPDKAEVGYTKYCREHADSVIHMTSRLNFIRPNGEIFLDKKTGRPQGPKFPVCIFLFTPFGLSAPIRDIYWDFSGYKPSK